MRCHALAGTLALSVVVVVAGCGDDSGDVTEQQRAAVESLTQSAAEEGVAFDEACLNAIVSEMSDDDLDKLIDNDADELSATGFADMIGFVGCIEEDSMVAMLSEEMARNGLEPDEECIRDALGQFDIAEVFAGASESVDGFNEALVACGVPGG